MKITKNVQYALTLVMYLHRAGKASLKDIAEENGYSLTFLEQIARKLRLAGVLKAQKGPGGGYQVVGTPTVYDVWSAVSTVKSISTGNRISLLKGRIEKRALAKYIEVIESKTLDLMRIPVVDLIAGVVALEVSALEKLTAESTVN